MFFRMCKVLNGSWSEKQTRNIRLVCNEILKLRDYKMLSLLRYVVFVSHLTNSKLKSLAGQKRPP